MKSKALSKGQVILYKNKVEVRLKKETGSVNLRLLNFSVCSILEHAATDGKSNVQEMHIANVAKPVNFGKVLLVEL